MTPTPRTVLYMRVSTAEQTSAHQLEQAREAGYHIEDSDVIVDHGVSGVSTQLADRPQGKRLFDLLRPGDTLLVRWVDRLGRSYSDVKSVIEGFNRNGVSVRTVINSMHFEADHLIDDPTRKAAKDAMLAFMAALAEADNTAKMEARRAGIAFARQSADADQKYRGRKPAYDRATFESVQNMLAKGGATVAAIAREHGLSRQAVLRIRDTPDASEAALRRWGM